MDMETGERLRDMETGELPAKPHLNQETGEIEINCTQPAANKKIFKIPTNYLKTNKKKIRQNILTKLEINDSNRMSPILLFLLPTIFCIPTVGIVLGIAEVLMHVWAHKKNKTLINKNIYYQSPLHTITSEFCRCCLDENMKNRITKIQDKRNMKYCPEYIGRIVT